MNEIVFNISLVILSIGFILLVIYITTLLTNKTCLPCAINSNNYLNDNQVNKLIYDDHPSITYLKMFKDPEVGFGKTDYDVKDYSEITAFYTKSNN